MATARPRYSTVVTARAMATARGSCRDGSAKRVVSGATASQPAKENISVAAALPTESQPCGANGVQLAARAAAPTRSTATTTTTVSRLTRTSWADGAGPQPAGGQADDDQQQRGRDGGAGELAAAGQLGDVTGADQADDRGAAHHPGQEHPAGRPARPRSQARGHVAHHPARGRDSAGPGPRTRRRTGRTGPASASQARIEAGPASAAARPGRSSRPGPRIAPMYSAAPREVVRCGADGSSDVSAIASPSPNSAPHAMANMAPVGPAVRNAVARSSALGWISCLSMSQTG